MPYGAAGYSAIRETGDWSGLFNAESGERNLLVTFATIVSTATDAGNTPTTTLRAGSILGIVTSTGKYDLYDPDGTNGTQNAVAVLGIQLPMQADGTTTVEDKYVPVISRGNLKVSQLHNYDANAGRQLVQRGCVLDAPAGATGLFGPAGVVFADGATVTAAQNGMLFQAAGAAAFTLPTPANGLVYEFYQTANNDMSITSASSSDDIVADGDATADSVTFSTSSEKIGSHARFACRYNAAGALRWYFSNLGGTTATVA